MKKQNQYGYNILSLILMSLCLSGCFTAFKAQINPSLGSIPEVKKKVPLKAALYVSPSTKEYYVRSPIPMGAWDFYFGEHIENVSFNAFSQVFEEMTIVREKQGLDRFDVLIEPEFVKDQMRVTMSFSKIDSHVALSYAVSDIDGVIWRNVFVGDKTGGDNMTDLARSGDALSEAVKKAAIRMAEDFNKKEFIQKIYAKRTPHNNIAKHPDTINRAGATAPVEDMQAYQRAKSLNTLKAYGTFLHEHPFSTSRRDALAAMALLIKQRKGSYEAYRKFIVEFEDGTEFVPSSYRLALIGPEGLRVHDILRLLKRGIEDTVIAAKIRSQNAVYKDFDFEEIGTLKKMGMTGPLIEAMLDSTTRAKRSQDELQKKKEMEDLLAEIQRTQKKLDTMKAAQEQQQSQSQAPAPVARTSNDSSVGDAVKNCAAQIAALEACKHLPWPANSVCAATAKSQFPCQ